MDCKDCGNALEVVLDSGVVVDVSSDGGWVQVQLDWYCPECEDYKGTTEYHYEQE